MAQHHVGVILHGYLSGWLILYPLNKKKEIVYRSHIDFYYRFAEFEKSGKGGRTLVQF